MVTLTVEQAAERLGVIPRRVRALIASGQLPAVKLGEGRRGNWQIKEADLRLVQMLPSGRRGVQNKSK
ncbi:MAG: helix-turn-helix domain-containing protein [Chthoniobacteraceae bacterium]|nr:helix-turn-helix domain-containing protein [Chthoniobacteraceae bacterium]